VLFLSCSRSFLCSFVVVVAFLSSQITASHLALASQSVGLVVSQLPVLRAALASRLPAKHHVLLHSLDRVGKDCAEHQREIFAKLVAIMDELIRQAREKIEAQPWAATKMPPAAALSAVPLADTNAVAAGGIASAASMAAAAAAASLSAEDASRVDDPIKVLMKQTCSLHRALSDLLLPEQRDGVFRAISHLFQGHVAELAQRVDQSRPLVAAKLAAQVAHIATRLATCTGVDEASVQQIASVAAGRAS
jgi:hypothetical protein